MNPNRIIVSIPRECKNTTVADCHYRIRSGDFRVLFHVVADELWIVRIEHRKDVYED
jgi:mRNA-degrading endonuclease RelE of RelBE toxin-antitoxin system